MAVFLDEVRFPGGSLIFPCGSSYSAPPSLWLPALRVWFSFSSHEKYKNALAVGEIENVSMSQQWHFSPTVCVSRGRCGAGPSVS